MKRRKLLKNKTASYIAASILTLALAGVTCGTFAWFNYDTRTPVSELNGTTIGLGELQAGFLSQVELHDYEQYGLIKDDSDPTNIIYWVDGHFMSSETINYVLGSNGYATRTLHPVTTQKYSGNEDIVLFSAPRVFQEIENLAEKEDYINLSLVFRYQDILDENNSYISNENIYLSNFKLTTMDEDTAIHRAIRVFTSDKKENRHLINPTSNEDGFTDVGGILDLNKDGFFDCEIKDEKLYEHLYGQITESNYKANPESTDTIVPEQERNSFIAGHKEGTYVLETFVPEVAEYEGFYGFRNKRKFVTATDSSTNNYAYLDLSIFVEGWDLNVIDSQKGLLFDLDLAFETSL